MKIAVVGANGFIVSALASTLVDEGHAVVAVSRHPPELPGIEARVADVSDASALRAALEGSELAFYLVHSLGTESFRSRDLQLAEGFGAVAAEVGIKRIVYLGGLGHAPSSEHLASRQEVGLALGKAGLPVVELRAAVVLGAGSISFEMLRYLTERLPLMVCPRWVHTAIQPIALSDVLRYLVKAIDVEPGVYDVGGADVTSYRRMIDEYALVR